MAAAEIRKILGLGILAASWVVLLPSSGWSQAVKSSPQAVPGAPAPPVVTVEQPDAQRTREELSRLLEHYPPTLRNVFATDPSLLSNQAYLAPYPALVN